MGGSESLLTGLNNLDKFAWIGAFSSGGLPEPFDKDFPGLDGKANPPIRLLWVACGTEDRLITMNRNFRQWLQSKSIPAHRYRNARNAHMDGVAQESVRVRAAAVPLIVCVAPDAGVARSAIGSIHKSISAHARCARGADEGVRPTRTFMAL